MFSNSPEEKPHFSEYFNLFYGCLSKPPAFAIAARAMDHESVSVQKCT